MTQTELNHEVSRATGECVRTIRKHGFSILRTPDDMPNDDVDILPAQIVNWDELDAERRRAA